jgi:hypothetical protein
MSKFDKLIAEKSKIYENVIGSNTQPGIPPKQSTTPPIAGVKPAQTTQQQQQPTQQQQQQQQQQEPQQQAQQTDPIKASQDAINILMQHKDNPAVQKLLATALQSSQSTQPAQTQQNA